MAGCFALASWAFGGLKGWKGIAMLRRRSTGSFAGLMDERVGLGMIDFNIEVNTTGLFREQQLWKCVVRELVQRIREGRFT